MPLPGFVVRQLAKPAGILGRIILWRLNKANHNMNAMTLDALAIEDRDRLLEIGFGGGALLEGMLRRGPESVAGVEISDVALARAQRRLAHAVASGKLELVAIEHENLPFNPGTFSKVCCVNVVYFWDDLSAMLSEVHRVLQAEGRFVLCYQQSGPNDRRTPPDRVERSLEDAGFQILATHGEHDKHNGDYFCTTAQKSLPE